MTDPISRPPWRATLLFALLTFGIGGWVMAHLYSDHDPGLCGSRYQQAKTAADSAAVDRWIPDTERAHLQPHGCGVLHIPDSAAFARADSLLSRAIAATGGDSALTHLTAIEWEGSETPGDSATGVTGLWRIAPPDTEVVRTWRPADSATTGQRRVVMGGSVWAESNGDSVSLTPDERNAERELVYWYSLIRLLPLRAPGALFWPLPTDSAGRPGLLTRTPGRLDVALYFGADGRIEVMRTTTFPTQGGVPSTMTMTLNGDLEIAGVHWFRDMRLKRDGKVALTLSITAARPATIPTARWIAEQ